MLDWRRIFWGEGRGGVRGKFMWQNRSLQHTDAEPGGLNSGPLSQLPFHFFHCEYFLKIHDRPVILIYWRFFPLASSSFAVNSRGMWILKNVRFQFQRQTLNQLSKAGEIEIDVLAQWKQRINFGFFFTWPGRAAAVGANNKQTNSLKKSK